MKGVRLIAAALCALLMLSLPVMADDGWVFPGIVAPSGTPAMEQSAEPSKEPESAPSTEPPQEPAGDSTGSGTEDGAEKGAGNTAGNNTGNIGEPSHKLDDGLWGDWKDPGNSGVRTELPSEEQQELEQARRELEEKQQQRDEAFREAERENAALPEEEEKQKKPAGSKAADAAPTELVLPQREARTGSPVRYILIGALLAGALCIAVYLFTHPAREDDPADETKP